MECPSCSSAAIWSHGSYRGYNAYECSKCRTRFSERTFSPFYGMNFPDAVIRFAVKTHYKYRLSTADTSRLLADLGIIVSDEAVRLWVQWFTELLKDELQLKRKYSKQWHVDESFVKVGSEQGYLWTVVDSNNNLLSIFLSEHRDGKSAVRCLQLAYKEAGFMPDVVVSDGYDAYPKAVRKTFGRGKVKHAVAHFKKEMFLVKGKVKMLSNNRIEGLFSHIKEHYHRFRGFKSFIAGNVIVNGIKLFYNLRHLS